jgi:HK97 gp10 family phage protein
MAQVRGGRELQEFLSQLPAKMEANVVRGGLRAGAKVISDAIRENCPEDSGLLKKSIKISTSIKSGTVLVKIKTGDKKAWYAHIVEFGARPHDLSRGMTAREERGGLISLGEGSRLHPGSRATGFIRKALDVNEQKAIDVAMDYMRNRLRTKHDLDVPDPAEVLNNET